VYPWLKIPSGELAVILPIFGVTMIFLIAADPGPRAKEFVEGLKNRLR